MSRAQMLRCLVSERLTAAAEEIFALFERTIAEYEEELCRSKEENQRNQRLLDCVQPQVPRNRAAVHARGIRNEEAVPAVNQDNVVSTHIKEEPKELNIKKKGQLQEFSAVLHFGKVKAHVSSETEEHTDDDEDWEPPASSSSQQMETEADGDHYNHVTCVQEPNLKYEYPTAQNTPPFIYSKTTPESSNIFRNSSISGSYLQSKTKLFMCPVCKKMCRSVHEIVTHIRVHSGEKPFRCPVCTRGFAQRGNLNTHLRIHTGERPFSCTQCNARFTRRPHLRLHMSSHGLQPGV